MRRGSLRAHASVERVRAVVRSTTAEEGDGLEQRERRGNKRRTRNTGETQGDGIRPACFSSIARPLCTVR